MRRRSTAGRTVPRVIDELRTGARADGIGVEGIDAIGMSLVDPVNVYSQADRASKYGVLFVLLTFVGFFMFELIKQLPIHPIQYGLVGLALAIFFLLLVSLSEHIAFAWAYLVASVACIGLLGFYLSHVLRSRARGLGFAAMLATLYAALYGLLVSRGQRAGARCRAAVPDPGRDHGGDAQGGLVRTRWQEAIAGLVPAPDLSRGGCRSRPALGERARTGGLKKGLDTRRAYPLY